MREKERNEWKGRGKMEGKGRVKERLIGRRREVSLRQKGWDRWNRGDDRGKRG